MATLVAGILLAFFVLATTGDQSPVDWNKIHRNAQSYLDRGNFEAALRAAKPGYERWRSLPPSSWHWPFRLQVAESLLELNHLDEARPLLLPGPAPSALEGRRLLGLAYLEYRLHDFDAAGHDIDTARLLIGEQAPELIARIELLRGMIQMKQQKYPDAEGSFRRALTTSNDPRSLMRCYALINLGFLHLVQFRYDEAVFWFERARSFASKAGVRRAEALAAGNLGVSYLWMGDIDRSLKLLNEAASISEALKDPVYAQRWLAKIGEAYEAGGDFSKAFESYEKARALARPGIDDDWLSDILANLTDVALEKGDIPTAERLNADALRLAETSGDGAALTIPRLNTARIAMARGETTLAESGFRNAIVTSRAAADPISQWEGHSGLAELYRTVNAVAAANTEYRNAIQVIEGERAKIGHDELKLTFLSHLIEFYQNYVDFLMERSEPASAFSVAASCRARVLAEKVGRPDAAAADAVSRLQQLIGGASTVLMSYWVAPRRSFLWVIDSSGLHSFVLPGQRDIDEHVRRWHTAILFGENPIERDGGSGRWLFARLVADHYQVPAGSRVIIVPDGSLYELNFETLPSAGDSREYWIRDVTVAVAPSLALLQPAEHAAGGRLLLIGNPDFQSDEFPKLSSVKAEMETVAGHFSRRDVYDSTAATPEAFRRAPAGSYSTVHFAAHAVANRENPLDSAIILSGSDPDHKLYAREIMAQQLRADLVTLSACQTAGSKTYGGEGLTGFAWAFLSAGARNVVAGLWDVDDGATAELMTHFYDSLERGQSPESALRSAKLTLIATSPVYRKPLYWAAFETFTRAMYGGSPTGGPHRAARSTGYVGDVRRAAIR